MSKGTLEVHALFEQAIPSTVLTKGLYPCINTPVQRKNFFAAGLHWQVFYLDMNEAYQYSPEGMYYKTSPDGINWSSPVLLTKPSTPGYTIYPDFFSLHFDGQFLHYTCNDYSYKIWYRKGIPNPDGTITWLAEPQIIHELDGIYCCDPTIGIDSEGYPFIGFYYGTTLQEPVVVKSSRNDGTWVMEQGFPYFLDQARKLIYRGVGVLGLLNKKVYALYYRAFKEANISPPLLSGVIYGKLWNGTSWEAQEQVTVSHVEQKEFHQLSYISVLDNVHLVFLRKGTGDLVYLIRQSTGWNNELVIATTTNINCQPQITYRPATDTIIVLWNEGDTVYYRKCVAGTWQSEIISWWKEFTPQDPISFSSKIISNEKEIGGIIGVAWLLYSAPDVTILRYNHLKQGM